MVYFYTLQIPRGIHNASRSDAIGFEVYLAHETNLSNADYDAFFVQRSH